MKKAYRGADNATIKLLMSLSWKGMFRNSTIYWNAP